MHHVHIKFHAQNPPQTIQIKQAAYMAKTEKELLLELQQ